MAVPKILLYSNRENEIDEYAELIEKASIEAELLVCRNSAEVESKIPEAEIIFGVHLAPEAYLAARRLRWIQSMWAGVEGLLKSPLPPAVTITKPFGVFGRYLSHYVFGNLLSKKIDCEGALLSQSKCEWKPYRIELISGKCMGIAGMGDVAAEIALAARAFGMQIVALNSDGRPHKLADQCFASRERERFVAACDVLVLTLPATDATRGMFNAGLLSHMRKDAWLINVGRGSLIDDSALIDILESGRIGGAVLDVFQEEPLPPEHPYWRLPNCVVTPHIAGPSLPAEITDCFLENFRRYRNSLPLLGLIDQERGY
ncbi:MAG: D-2-hydroxyacid dehydrogenase [Candidatus Obscuribacterales bacterium]|nr:D-2-hydroxyacid dehydrogenase [Candidatus Obscuribacterales bacterium]